MFGGYRQAETDRLAIEFGSLDEVSDALSRIAERSARSIVMAHSLKTVVTKLGSTQTINVADFY
jgi:hypothetical protein